MANRMLNKVIMIGRLTENVQLTTFEGSNGNNTLAAFSIANDTDKTDKNGNKISEYRRCEIWGNYGKSLANNTVRGLLICITGSLDNNFYTGKDGRKVYQEIIRVEE